LSTILDIDYEIRRGYIAITDRSTGAMRCLHCGAVWFANIRGGGHYHRGSWTCHDCGANSKGGFAKRVQ
jgi:hypothetical protein